MSEGLRAADGALLWGRAFLSAVRGGFGAEELRDPGGRPLPSRARKRSTGVRVGKSGLVPRSPSAVSGHIARSRAPLLLSSGAPEEGEHQAAPTLN